MEKDHPKVAVSSTARSANEKHNNFDRKSYRVKRYSKKYKLDRWEKQRHEKLIRNYYKEINCDPLDGKFQKRTFDSSSDNLKDVNDEAIEIDNHIPGRFVLLPEKLAERKVEINKSERSVENRGTKSRQHRKQDAYALAKQQFKRIQEEKKSEHEKTGKAASERKAALDQYQKKKAERFKKLSQKTKKGQPVMKGRLELLFDKIQKSL